MHGDVLLTDVAPYFFKAALYRRCPLVPMSTALGRGSRRRSRTPRRARIRQNWTLKSFTRRLGEAKRSGRRLAGAEPAGIPPGGQVLPPPWRCSLRPFPAASRREPPESCANWYQTPTARGWLGPMRRQHRGVRVLPLIPRFWRGQRAKGTARDPAAGRGTVAVAKQGPLARTPPRPPRGECECETGTEP